jgi:hypothetical protein
MSREMTAGELRDLLDRMIANDPSLADVPVCDGGRLSGRAPRPGGPVDVLLGVQEETSWTGTGRWVFLKFEQAARLTAPFPPGVFQGPPLEGSPMGALPAIFMADGKWAARPISADELRNPDPARPPFVRTSSSRLP